MTYYLNLTDEERAEHRRRLEQADRKLRVMHQYPPSLAQVISENEDRAHALAEITRLIGCTNNGKLMLRNVPLQAQRWVSHLIASGDLRRASFMQAGDSVRLPD